MTYIEFVAAAFGVVCVWLTARQNIWCWPAGLVQVLLYIAVFWHARLYSDVLLHCVYVVLQFYGWWNWRYGKRDQQPLMVSRLPADQWLFCGVVAGTATVGLGYATSRLGAALPYWDASIA